MAMKKPQKANWQDSFTKKMVGQDDMTLLSKVNNEDINDNLRKRFEASIIYTYIGHVLIAVNPYRDLGLYGDHILQQYIGKNRIEMPPHVYAIAEAAYHQLIGYKENQCVIISGESGAGKTESAKKIMEYVAAVSKGQGAKVDKVKNIVLATNPLLESFGNAKTLRNNNSSRFGKYFEIEFNAEGEPIGGVITNYLLEKGRVCTQIMGERNFHIFYNFTRGASAQYKTDFQLQGPEYFVYTSQSKCLNVDGMNDAQDFQDVLNAMNTIGVTPAEQYSIFQLLAAILWLGNIQFYEISQDQAAIQDPSVLEMVAYLLEIDNTILSKTFETRVMETSRGGQRGTTYNVPLNCPQAGAVRDALAKSIFDRLFDWIVVRINQSMQTASTQKLLLGVLDIYGFEVFEHNSFEQLCINYVNEKLQQIFIELTLKQEQEEYVREKIKWTPIDFFNNKIVCDLIEEKKPPGIFSIMDDACATAHADPAAADKSLMQRLGTLGSNPHFKDLGQAGFLIRHYAGDVTYEAFGMTDKNKDQLGFDILEAIQLSRNNFLLSLFPEKVDRNDKKKPTTASTKIKTSCNALVTALSKCTPHYIRCIKPNDNKQPGEYDLKRCVHQIKYLGLLENIRVRRAGFAFRQIFEKFLERFFLLSRRTSYAGEYTWTGDAMSGCRAICEDCGISKDAWQIGTTKVFIRHPETLWALEHLRERYWHNMAMKIQRAYKNYVRYKNECARRIQRVFKSWNNTKVYLQVRDYGHQVLGSRKERRRFSLVSMRRFLGDYLDFASNSVLQNACGSGAQYEGILFTSKAQIVVHKTFKSPKPYPRFLVMTKQAIYIIETKVEKNLAVTTLERRIPLSAIQGVGLSPNMDDCVVLFVPSEYDCVLFLMFKTEFITHLAWHTGGNLSVNIAPMLEYMKKPGKKAKIQFAKDELAKNDFIMKKGIVSIATGLPATRVSDPPCRRNEPPPKPITTGKLLKKSGPPSQKPPMGQAQKPPMGYSQQPPMGQNQPPQRPPPQNPTPAPSSGPRYKALYDYAKQENEELSFQVGAILEIVHKSENGWWTAKCQGQQGLVPSNYLEEIKEAPPKPMVQKPTAAPIPQQQQQQPPQNQFRPPQKPATQNPAQTPPTFQKPPPTFQKPPQENPTPSPKPGGFVPPNPGQVQLRPSPKPTQNPTPNPTPKPSFNPTPNPSPKPNINPNPAPKPQIPTNTQNPPPKPVMMPKPSDSTNPNPAPKPKLPPPTNNSNPTPSPKPNINPAPKPQMTPKPNSTPPPNLVPKPGMKPPVNPPPSSNSGPPPSNKPMWATTIQRPPSPDENDNDDDWD